MSSIFDKHPDNSLEDYEAISVSFLDEFSSEEIQVGELFRSLEEAEAFINKNHPNVVEWTHSIVSHPDCKNFEELSQLWGKLVKDFVEEMERKRMH